LALPLASRPRNHISRRNVVRAWLARRRIATRRAGRLVARPGLTVTVPLVVMVSQSCICSAPGAGLVENTRAPAQRRLMSIIAGDLLLGGFVEALWTFEGRGRGRDRHLLTTRDCRLTT